MGVGADNHLILIEVSLGIVRRYPVLKQYGMLMEQQKQNQHLYDRPSHLSTAERREELIGLVS